MNEQQQNTQNCLNNIVNAPLVMDYCWDHLIQKLFGITETEIMWNTVFSYIHKHKMKLTNQTCWGPHSLTSFRSTHSLIIDSFNCVCSCACFAFRCAPSNPDNPFGEEPTKSPELAALAKQFPNTGLRIALFGNFHQTLCKQEITPGVISIP